MPRFLIAGALAFGLVLLAAVAGATGSPGGVLGRWLTEPKDGIIEITQLADGTLQGRIVGGAYPGKKDADNPDPALRERPLRGQVILRGLKSVGDDRWSGGTIYKPDGGRTYKCNVELRSDGTLKVRGYIGFSLLGVSQTWTRYTGTSLDLPPPK
ncbi:MAG: DUF2147 domain-containing protein [Gammaproteobacteria bacterium]|nr:DUF2147 domain-containing protein [Gammaproteobacteria bacterium]